MLWKEKYMSIRMKILQSKQGDAILIRYGKKKKEKCILIDSGRKDTYETSLKIIMDDLREKNKSVNLAVITHIDSDHIGGIVKYLSEIKNDKVTDIIEGYWFNSSRIISDELEIKNNLKNEIEIHIRKKELTLIEGLTLEEYLEETKKGNMMPIVYEKNKNIIEKLGVKITLLSPTMKVLEKLEGHWKDEYGGIKPFNLSGGKKNDYSEYIETLNKGKELKDQSISNRSSIAFIFEYNEIKLLLLGDSHADIIEESLREMGYNSKNKLVLDCVKISHHGSKKNISSKLIEILDTATYIICTDGKKENLPNKESFARILCNPERNKKKKINFIFNYNTKELKSLFTLEELNEYNFEVHYKRDLRWKKKK